MKNTTICPHCKKENTLNHLLGSGFKKVVCTNCGTHFELKQC